MDIKGAEVEKRWWFSSYGRSDEEELNGREGAWQEHAGLARG